MYLSQAQLTNPMLKTFLSEMRVGGNILNLVTVGIHNNPLCIYREYIQNAADSIAVSDIMEKGKVEIKIESTARRLTIRDNGSGLSYAQSIKELLPVASSYKRPESNRGFRGIGRLSGLAFADSVTFLTRSTAKEPVTCIKWDGTSLRKGIANGFSPEKVISQCVTIETTSEGVYPKAFFQVEINNIARFAAGSILNRDVVRDYITEVCPVSFAADFSYTPNILSIFGGSQSPLTLDIFLNDSETPLTKRHNNAIRFSGDRCDRLLDLEKFTIPAIDGDGQAAVGWVAHSSYLGAIPKKLGIRCIRARVGNIQIGDETLFDHLFTESRFNRWCIAEIHILDHRIIPNGKRDYFEPGPHARNLENHLGVMCRKIEQRCRTASGKRNKVQRFRSFLKDIDATYALAKSGYLYATAARQLIDKKLTAINRMRENMDKLEVRTDEVMKLDELEKKLVDFKARPGRVSLTDIVSSEVSTYREIFRILAEISPSSMVAMETIETILVQVKRQATD